jgi:amino acid transporter/nucleotide-binding universal stress UspA family protein
MDAVKNLERRLTLSAVVAISIGSMLGSGIFVLPGVAITETGPSVWLAYLLASISVIPAALSKAELATAMPASGGTYVYVERTFGPLAGTVAGLGLWLSLLLKSAFALIGIGAYLSIVSQIPVQYVAIGMLVAILALNVFGIGKVSNAVIALVTLSIVSLVIIGIMGALQIEPANYQPFMPNGMEGLLAASGIVFVSYAGVTKVAAIAGEVKDPEKNLPRGIMISLVTVALIYVAITAIFVGVVPWSQSVGDIKPIHTLAKAVGGTNFGYFAAAVAILTMFSMANAGVLAASRFPFAMARDLLLPSPIGKLNPKFLTPITSIVLSCLLVVVAILFLDVVKIAKLASAFILIIYVIENVVVMVLRETRVQWYVPKFKSPLYPSLQVFGIISGVVLLVGMGQLVIAAILSVVVPGVLTFFLYSRKRIERRGVVGIRGRRQDLVDEEPQDTDEEFPSAAKVVVPLFGQERSPEMLVELALTLSGGDKLVEVVHLTEVPEQTDLEGMDQIDDGPIRSLKRRLRAMSAKRKSLIHFDPVISHDIYQTVHQISNRLHCQWLVKEWGGRTHGTFTINNQMGWLEDHLACNVMTFRDAGVRYFQKLMVLVRAQKNDELLVTTADHLAEVYNAKLCLVTYVSPGSEKNAKTNAQDALNELKSLCKSETETLILDGPNALESIIEATVNYDLVVLRNQPSRNRLDRYFGSKTDKIIELTACSVISIKG